MIFIDTDIAIAVRDADPETADRVFALDSTPVISIMTRIELENGVHRFPAESDRRRRLLDRMLARFEVKMFTQEDILAYGAIVRQLGHDRIRTLDRLIGAQAITRDALFITRNGKDFRRIDKLRLEIWPVPAPPPF